MPRALLYGEDHAQIDTKMTSKIVLFSSHVCVAGSVVVRDNGSEALELRMSKKRCEYEPLAPHGVEGAVVANAEGFRSTNSEKHLHWKIFGIPSPEKGPSVKASK